jgi:hypothetical protein
MSSNENQQTAQILSVRKVRKMAFCSPQRSSRRESRIRTARQWKVSQTTAYQLRTKGKRSPSPYECSLQAGIRESKRNNELRSM